MSRLLDLVFDALPGKLAMLAGLFGVLVVWWQVELRQAKHEGAANARAEINDQAEQHAGKVRDAVNGARGEPSHEWLRKRYCRDCE